MPSLRLELIRFYLACCTCIIQVETCTSYNCDICQHILLE